MKGVENNPFWGEERVYSKAEAFLYLLDLAERNGGWIVPTIREYGRLWRWHRNRVGRFIEGLKREGILHKSGEENSSFGTPSGTLLVFGSDWLSNSCKKKNPQSGTPCGTACGTPYAQPNLFSDGDLSAEVIVEAKVIDPLSFDVVWDLYDKKKGRDKCEKKWATLSRRDKQAIVDYIPAYKAAQPDKQYRKDFSTFLNQRAWEDELIYNDGRYGREERIRETADAIRRMGEMYGGGEDVPF